MHHRECTRINTYIYAILLVWYIPKYISCKLRTTTTTTLLTDRVITRLKKEFREKEIELRYVLAFVWCIK